MYLLHIKFVDPYASEHLIECRSYEIIHGQVIVDDGDGLFLSRNSGGGYDRPTPMSGFNLRHYVLAHIRTIDVNTTPSDVILNLIADEDMRERLRRVES